MGKRTANSEGFSPTFLILTLVAVGVLVLLGVMLYKNAHIQTASAPAASDGSVAATTPTKTEATTSPTASNATADTTTLTIKEWGVKFKLTDPTISDAYYEAPKVNASNGLDYVGLGTKATNVELTCSDGSTKQQTTIDYIFRSTDQNKVVLGDSSAATKVGDYYYSIENETGAGCDNTSSSAPLRSDVSKKFTDNWAAGNFVAN